MPIYEYQPTEEGCKRCSGGFEVFQQMNEEPLESCPDCDTPVEKLVSSFGTGPKDVLSNRNLEQHGFSKLRKTNDGNYEKEV